MAKPDQIIFGLAYFSGVVTWVQERLRQQSHFYTVRSALGQADFTGRYGSRIHVPNHLFQMRSSWNARVSRNYYSVYNNYRNYYRE